jgi:hypothetical protein
MSEKLGLSERRTKIKVLIRGLASEIEGKGKVVPVL